MKKLFAASLILVAIVCFSFQNKDSILVERGPSVFEPILTQNLASDTLDIDEQMRVLEKEMKVWEAKMKPYKEAMEKVADNMKPHENDMKEMQVKMKPLEKQMRILEKKMKAATSDDEREKISDEMGKVGDEMGKVGDEMSGHGDKMSVVGDEMSALGDKMSAIGDEMSKIGDKMSLVGEKMEARHKKVFSWFFKELKKDGIINEGKCSIIMEAGIFIVNGKTLSQEQLQKYKKGIEERLGKPLKTDFSVHFKGTLESVSDNDFEFNGMSNSDY